MDDTQVSSLVTHVDDLLFPKETSRSLPMALLRAREAVMARFRPMLAKYDVTEQQWRVLRILKEYGEIDATALAERACILAPSLTRILRSLDERGLIHRQPHAEDGRRSMIRISDTGTELIQSVAPEGQSIYAELERRFGPDQIKTLLDMLEELTVAMKR